MSLGKLVYTMIGIIVACITFIFYAAIAATANIITNKINTTTESETSDSV